MLDSYLIRIVGKDNVIVDDVDLLCYSRDLTPYVFKPQAVVFPQTTEQVSQILSWANKERVPVTPRGSGASFTGSSLPRKGGIVLDMSKMNKIKVIQPEDFVVVAEPGINIDELNRQLAKFGLIFPHDVGSHSAATLGGMAASAAHGHHGLKYGPIRNWILGLEIVLPYGKVIRTGSKAPRSSCGYDLTRLFIGSEGTLGVITELTFRVIPLPQHRATIGVFYNDLKEAMSAVSAIIRSGADPSAIEFVDRVALEYTNRVENFNFPIAEAMLIIDIEEYSGTCLNEQVKIITGICSKFNGRNIQVAYEPFEAEKLWKPRYDIDVIVTKEKPGFREVGMGIADPCVPLSKMAEVISKMQHIFSKHDIFSVILAHAGVGIIHPAFFIDVNDSNQWKALKRAEEEIIEVVLKAGGTITGEHGIGIIKIPFMGLELGDSLEIMRQIKRVIDPNNIMNPGKLGLDVITRDETGHSAFSSYYED